MKQEKINKHFSIFEVLVVLSILSILASLIFSSFGFARDEAKRTQCLNNLRQIQSIVEVFKKDHRATPSAEHKYDFRFAQNYVDESSLAIFRCPGDKLELVNTDLEEAWFFPVLNYGTSYEYIPSKKDAENDPEDDFSGIYEFMMIYDKDARFHNGRFNVVYLHGMDNNNGGIARTENHKPGITPPRVTGDPEGEDDPEGEGRNNHGHGNNEDGVDMSNPGKAPKTDGDKSVDDERNTGRGNINDEEFDDYVDAVNNGQSKK
ncbi:type II secretion system protein [Lentisphaera marina]|uniref:type II secretion system protein n=1 Tax=Lentisphaera marina TaxID=1111041 RepID=UPI002365FA4F|nr:type II secretion system protein [Lentisphaera marina]MDD7987092.1 type II secretion system protein [Lentisphaera marina]